MTKFILFGGKGGVGKTTCASATAISLAKDGHKTLVISTDPAHSIGDVFEKEINPDPTRVSEENELFALEVDPNHRFTEKYAGTAEALMNEAGKFGVDVNTDEFSDFDGGIIGSDEAAVIDLFAEYDENGDWDYIVFDTAPTGHTLRMLKLPEVLDSTFGTVLNVKSQIDGVKDTVTGLFGGKNDKNKEQGLDDVNIDETRNKLKKVSDILVEPDKTQFFAVMEPEKLSLDETKRLLNQLEKYNISSGGVIVNKVLTDIDESCNLCSSRYEQQQGIINSADEEIDIPLLQISLKDSTPTGNKLHKIAEKISVS
jgi:arsenite-transporting ATPase